MKPLLLSTLSMLALSSPACEVAELPPLAEVRDARDSVQSDTTAETAEPDTTQDADTADPDSAEPDGDTALADTEPSDTDPADTDPADTGLTDTDPADTGLTDTDPADTFTDTDPADTDPADTFTDTGSDASTDTDPLPSCTPAVATHPVAASPHVATCSAVTYETDPPTSGPHYPVWAAFKTYGVAINPGFLVHALEHGAIVITWRCDNGCEASLTALRAMLEARAADPLCDPLVKHRVIVAPRPTQDVALAAWGWGASWKADCFDLDSLSDFIDAWYAKGPENVCAQGVDIETILPDNAWYCPP